MACCLRLWELANQGNAVVKHKLIALFLSLSAGIVAVPAWADLLLTIRAGDKIVEISGDEFSALETVEYATSTDWTDGASTFNGPLVRDVIESAGVDPTEIETIHATAEIPTSDIIKYKVILATKMDGKRLTLRDKGPLWVVYPRDDHAELNDPEINARWIWQLVELKLE